MDSPISIRVTADAEDRPFPQLSGPVVLAEQCGEAVGAIELESGDAAVDPERSVSGLLSVHNIHRLEARLMAALVGG
jgi:hypothetical protein